MSPSRDTKRHSSVKEYTFASRGPIFIGGLAHSGKTELRLLLSSHPNISLTRRTYMWTRFYNRYGDLGSPDNFERCLTAMLSEKHVQVLEPDPIRIRREFWQGLPTYARLFALFHDHYASRVGKVRWGDQLGFIEHYADPIFAAYPEAKMFHMIRDPRTRYQSTKSLSRQRKGKVGWDTGRWLYSVSLAKRNQRLYPNQYKVIQYESFALQPEQTLRDVCAFIGEDYVTAMRTVIEATSLGDKQGDGLYSEFELEANSREITFVQTYARHDMLACGYSPEPIQLSCSDRLLFYCVDLPINWAGMMAWHTLKNRRLA
ncbi:MAG: sulfotransferase [Anaerolineae bacterium]|nr:sulfotransferase [Anaerolineae bacterium]